MKICVIVITDLHDGGIRILRSVDVLLQIDTANCPVKLHCVRTPQKLQITYSHLLVHTNGNVYESQK